MSPHAWSVPLYRSVPSRVPWGGAGGRAPRRGRAPAGWLLDAPPPPSPSLQGTHCGHTFLWSPVCPGSSTGVNPLNADSKDAPLLPRFYRWGNGAPVRLGEMPNVTGEKGDTGCGPRWSCCWHHCPAPPRSVLVLELCSLSLCPGYVHGRGSPTAKVPSNPCLFLLRCSLSTQDVPLGPSSHGQTCVLQVEKSRG